MVTVFLSILDQMDFHLPQDRKENCHHDHIPFNLTGNGILVFSVQTVRRTAVREAGVSWHRGGLIEESPETPRTSRQYGTRGLNRVIIMPFFLTNFYL